MSVHAGYISPDVVIADVAKIIDDEKLKEFSYGDHLSQIQQALTELACDTLYDERTYEGEVPRSGITGLPSGLVNLEQAFLFDGDRCHAGNQQTLWWARNYSVYGGSGFKENRAGKSDPIMERAISSSTEGTLYYFNVIGNTIHFGPACLRYSKFLLRYRGIGASIGETPIIPYELRQAVKNYAAMAALTVLFARDPKRWHAVLANIKRDHFGGQSAMDVGSWKQAQRRVQSSHIKWRRDLSKYLSAPHPRK